MNILFEALRSKFCKKADDKLKVILTGKEIRITRTSNDTFIFDLSDMGAQVDNVVLLEGNDITIKLPDLIQEVNVEN